MLEDYVYFYNMISLTQVNMTFKKQNSTKSHYRSVKMKATNRQTHPHNTKRVKTSKINHTKNPR